MPGASPPNPTPPPLLPFLFLRPAELPSRVRRFLTFLWRHRESIYSWGIDSCLAQSAATSLASSPLRGSLQTAHPLAWAPLWLLSHFASSVRTEGKNVFSWALAACAGGASSLLGGEQSWENPALQGSRSRPGVQLWFYHPLTLAV